MAYPSFGHPLPSTSMSVSGQHQFFQSSVLGSYGSNNATVNNEGNSTTSNGNEGNSDNDVSAALSTGNYLVPLHPCLRPCSGGYALHAAPDVSHPHPAGIYGNSLLAYSRPVHGGEGGGGLPDPVYRPPTYITAVASGHRSYRSLASAVDSAGVTGVCYPSAVTDVWKGVSQSTSGWTYDLSIGGVYPYSTSYGGGLDVRRKNATRESTSTLKAWLYEHIKNPYPTKGEKIMLAIITKMTLTQVSTWFANARRRLKKENKMQWSPNKKNDDHDDDDNDDDGDDDNDDANSNNNNDDDDDNARLSVVDDDNHGPMKNQTLHGTGHEATTLMTSAKSSSSRLTMTHPMEHSSSFSHSTIPSNISISPSRRIAQNHFDSASKPRIWCLADVATSADPDRPKSMSVDPRPLTFQRPKFQPWTESVVSYVRQSDDDEEEEEEEEEGRLTHNSSLSSFSLPLKDEVVAGVQRQFFRRTNEQFPVGDERFRQPQAQVHSSKDTSTSVDVIGCDVLVTRVCRSSMTEADGDDVTSNSTKGLSFVLKEERKSE